MCHENALYYMKEGFAISYQNLGWSGLNNTTYSSVKW